MDSFMLHFALEISEVGNWYRLTLYVIDIDWFKNTVVFLFAVLWIPLRIPSWLDWQIAILLCQVTDNTETTDAK